MIIVSVKGCSLKLKVRKPHPLCFNHAARSLLARWQAARELMLPRMIPQMLSWWQLEAIELRAEAVDVAVNNMTELASRRNPHPQSGVHIPRTRFVLV